MNTTTADEVANLINAVSSAAKQYGAQRVNAMHDGSLLLQEWLSHLDKTKKTGTADYLLEGVTSALVETAAAVSLGLARPALFAMRGQIDLLLCWLYFKDHPVELGQLDTTGEGFKLKKEIFQYLETFQGFGLRFGLLKQTKTRTQDDPYRLLSAHVHGQSKLSAPKISSLKQLVASVDICDEVTALQRECAEFTSDVLLALYASTWAAFPTSIKGQLNRLNAEQKKAFFC